MSKLREQLLAVATSYAANRGQSLLRFLGDGNDGAVWESDQQTAIKKTLEKATSFKPTFRSWPESVGRAGRSRRRIDQDWSGQREW
jgi:hypothetical protein